MYPHMIEVHDTDLYNDGNECQFTLNIDNICGFNPYCDDKNKTVIATVDNSFHVVLETYEEVKELIRDAGCIIAKKDPRLDDRPLGMNDLMTMVGEPVWNVHMQKWMLYEGVYDGILQFQETGNGRAFINADDLDKFPMYRIRCQVSGIRQGDGSPVPERDGENRPLVP